MTTTETTNTTNTTNNERARILQETIDSIRAAFPGIVVYVSDGFDEYGNNAVDITLNATSGKVESE